MNKVALANFDERRDEASRVLSPSARKTPILWVEGNDDAMVLCHFWDLGNNPEFDIRILSILRSKENQNDVIILEGKTGVIEKVNSTSKGTESYGLVDMDHDFIGLELTSDAVWDTNPKVVLNSYFLEGESLKKMVKEICIREAGIVVSKDDFKHILRLSRIYTFIKLFKGKNSTEKENWGGYSWDEVDFDSSNFNEFIAQLHFDDKDSIGLLSFIEEYSDSLSVCGINDHMLIRSIYLFCKRYSSIGIEQQSLELALKKYRLIFQMPSFLNELRAKIKKCHFEN